MTYRIVITGKGFYGYQSIYWRVKNYSIEHKDGFVVLKITNMKGLQSIRMLNKDDLSRIIIKELDRTVMIDHTIMEREE